MKNLVFLESYENDPFAQEVLIKKKKQKQTLELEVKKLKVNIQENEKQKALLNFNSTQLFFKISKKSQQIAELNLKITEYNSNQQKIWKRKIKMKQTNKASLIVKSASLKSKINKIDQQIVTLDLEKAQFIFKISKKSQQKAELDFERAQFILEISKKSQQIAELKWEISNNNVDLIESLDNLNNEKDKLEKTQCKLKEKIIPKKWNKFLFIISCGIYNSNEKQQLQINVITRKLLNIKELMHQLSPQCLVLLSELDKIKQSNIVDAGNEIDSIFPTSSTSSTTNKFIL